MQHIIDVKDEGNDEFKRKEYQKELDCYDNGIRAATGGWTPTQICSSSARSSALSCTATRRS